MKLVGVLMGKTAMRERGVHIVTIELIEPINIVLYKELLELGYEYTDVRHLASIVSQLLQGNRSTVSLRSTMFMFTVLKDLLVSKEVEEVSTVRCIRV